MSVAPVAFVDSDFARSQRLRRFLLAGPLAVLCLMLCALPDLLHAEDAKARPARFGFSSTMFNGVNETDARAALKIWTQTVAAQLEIPFDPSFGVLTGSSAIRDAFLQKTIDAASMTAVEFWEVRQSVPFGPSVILSPSQGAVAQEYLLLVHRDDPVVNLVDLRASRITIYDGPHGSLCAIWLETLLLEAQLGNNAGFFGKIALSGKTSQSVLPVFFRQMDACIVTREGFQTMCELNPQVGRQLRVLLRSPRLIAAVCCFDANYVSPTLNKIIANIGNIAGNEAGRQTLGLFHIDRLLIRPLAIMDETCALLDRHRQLLAEHGKPAIGPAGSDSPGTPRAAYP